MQDHLRERRQVLRPHALSAAHRNWRELSWDDIVDGNVPPTRQQRMQKAVLQAAEQLQEQADLLVTHDRPTRSLDLVLSNAVALYQDNTASVRSGSRSYTVANGGCTWADAKQRGACYKHQLEVAIRRRAAALLQEASAAAAGKPEAAAAMHSAASGGRPAHDLPYAEQSGAQKRSDLAGV